eukprot:3156914-Lingulodinium_polyedra.AAC.1
MSLLWHRQAHARPTPRQRHALSTVLPDAAPAPGQRRADVPQARRANPDDTFTFWAPQPVNVSACVAVGVMVA